MNVRVVLFPDGEDPDSYARSHRSSEVQEYISQKAQDFISFKTNLLSQEVKNDPIKKAGLIKEIVQTISIIPDPITRQVYVKECSSLMQMPEQTLLNELNKKLRKKFTKSYASDPTPPTHPTAVAAQDPVNEDLRTKLSYQEENLARLLLEYGHSTFTYKSEGEEDRDLNVAAVIIDQLEMDSLQFENPIYRQIYLDFVDSIDKGEFKKISYFVNHPEEKVAKFCIDVFSNPYELSPNWMDKKQIYVKTEKDHLRMSVINSILSYKLSVLVRDIKELQNQLKDAPEEEMMKILGRIGKKEHQKNILSKNLGRTILR
jgi:DNA primase